MPSKPNIKSTIPNVDSYQFTPKSLSTPKFMKNVQFGPSGIGLQGNINKQLGKNVNLNVGANKKLIDYGSNRFQRSNSPMNYNAGVNFMGKNLRGNLGLNYAPGSKPVYGGTMNTRLGKNISANLGFDYNPNSPESKFNPNVGVSFRKRFAHGGPHNEIPNTDSPEAYNNAYTEDAPVVGGVPIFSVNDPRATASAELYEKQQQEQRTQRGEEIYNNMQQGFLRQNLANPMVNLGDAAFVTGAGASATGVGAGAGVPLMAAGTASSIIPRMSEQLSLRALQKMNPNADLSQYIDNTTLASQALEVAPVAKAYKLAQKGYKFGKKLVKHVPEIAGNMYDKFMNRNMSDMTNETVTGPGTLNQQGVNMQQQESQQLPMARWGGYKYK